VNLAVEAKINYC